MFLIKNVRIVGKNCKLSSWIEKDGSKFVVRLQIPLNGFDSGNKKRDRDVRSILGKKGNKFLLVKSAPFSRAELKKWYSGQNSILWSADLVIADRAHRLKLKLDVDSERIRGSASGSFQRFGLSTPGFSAIAKVDPKLKLSFHLRNDKIKDLAPLMGE